MKTTLTYLVLIAVPALTGCVTVQDTLMLRNVEVEGSLAQPPVHVTSASMEAGSFSASPHVSVASGTISTTLDPQYDGPIGDSLPFFQPEGLRWNVPRVTYGMNLDYAVDDAIAFSGGISASLSEKRQHTGIYAGIGLYSATPTISYRFDVGMQVIDIQYSGATVILRSIDGEPTDTLFFQDRGKNFQPNVFASLTLNSSRKDRDLNWFIQLGISPQRLTSYVPEQRVDEYPGIYTVSDLRAESSVFWISATPGLYVTLPSDHRMLLGVRFMREAQRESSAPDFLAMPMVQFDWSL